MTTLLELKNVTKIFGGGLFRRKTTVALDDVSLAIDENDSTIMTIAGESGSGKTTMGLLLLGFVSPTDGQVLYKGQDIQALNGGERVAFRRNVQAIFQDPFAVYNPFYRVDHLLETPITKFKLANSKSAARALMEEALEGVGLRPEETLGRYPHQLSGGQRQRIVVARALLLKPRLIIADEPVSMVDASLRATILESLRKLNQDFGISIIYITHDLTTAYHISNQIVVLYGGSIMEAGNVDDVIKNPQHPYTQLLVDSIPWPDLDRKWGQDQAIIKDEGTAGATLGCKFVSRCPHVMPQCQERIPSLYHINPTRAASCFLYDEQPTIAREEIGKLFTSNAQTPA